MLSMSPSCSLHRLCDQCFSFPKEVKQDCGNDKGKGKNTSEHSMFHVESRWGERFAVCLLGFGHKGSGLWVISEAPRCRPLVCRIPQHLLPPVTTVDAAVVHDQHHNG